MTQFLVVAQEIETGKNFSASKVLDTRKEAQDEIDYIQHVIKLDKLNPRYTYSILEFDA